MTMKNRADSRGFTLVEVMVALVVVAVAIPALLKALYSQVDGTAYLRDKSVAQWVAGNKMVESRLLLARNGRLFRGERRGTETMAGQEWYWLMTSRETEVENFYRLEIEVGRDEAGATEPLYTLVGFIAAENAGEDE
jgi:general secretion pathway protein I